MNIDEDNVSLYDIKCLSKTNSKDQHNNAASNRVRALVGRLTGLDAAGIERVRDEIKTFNGEEVAELIRMTRRTPRTDIMIVLLRLGQAGCVAALASLYLFARQEGLLEEPYNYVTIGMFAFVCIALFKWYLAKGDERTNLFWCLAQTGDINAICPLIGEYYTAAYPITNKGRVFAGSSSGIQELRASLLRLCDTLKTGDQVSLTTWQRDGMIGLIESADAELVCGLLRVIAVGGDNVWLGHVVRLEAGFWSGEASESVRAAAAVCKAALEIAHVRQLAR